MPCDEQHVYAAEGIYKHLPEEIKNVTFPMPMFMDYLIQTKTVGNWIMAFMDTLYSAKKLYECADKDLIVIGTLPTTCEFDAIFNFQEIDESLPYEDKFLEKIKEIVKPERVLSDMVDNLVTADKSIFALHDCKATADFLSKYIKTDVKEILNALENEFAQIGVKTNE